LRSFSSAAELCSVNHCTRINLYFFSAPRKPKDPNSSTSPKKKGGKKRNPWSDSDDEASDISDEDIDGSFLETVIPADRGPRRAAGKIYSLVYL